LLPDLRKCRECPRIQETSRAVSGQQTHHDAPHAVGVAARSPLLFFVAFGGPGDYEPRILSDAFGGNCKTALQLSCSFCSLSYINGFVRKLYVLYGMVLYYVVLSTVLCHISPVFPQHATIAHEKLPTLGGAQQNGMPLRLVCISPSISSASETISSLEFATRAMDVEVHVPRLQIRWEDAAKTMRCQNSSVSNFFGVKFGRNRAR